MQLSLILFSAIFCLINFVATDESHDNAKPEIARRPSPLLILTLMPKVIEKLRERLPRQNIDFLFPLLFKEIQETIQLPQFSSLEPSVMPGLIATMVEHMIQKITNLGQPTSPPTSYTDSPYDREAEGQPKMPEVVELNVAKQQKLTQDLPDLAFDRDPSRMKGPQNESPESKIDDDDDDDEFGYVPSQPSINRENISLGEYDEETSKTPS